MASHFIGPDPIKPVVQILERQGYEIKKLGTGGDGIEKWVVHRRDPSTAKYYNPRSYFSRDGLIALAVMKSKLEIRDAIAASQRNNPYILLREDESVKKKTNAATEKANREAKAASKKSAASKTTTTAKAAKVTKAAPAKSAKKAPAAKATKKVARDNGYVPGQDAVVDMLATYQDKTTTERMTAPNMVNLYKRISAASYDEPVANSSLNLYDKRQARELARLGLVSKERIEGIGLAYFPNK